MTNWRGLPAEQLEASYNPRVAAADAAGDLARFEQRSRQARETIAGFHRVDEDLRYGSGSLTTLDLYRPGLQSDVRTPLVIFIHGGYWRALDKSDHSFVAPPLLQAGCAVANVNYDLCPAITLDTMVEQVIEAVRFCADRVDEWQIDPNRFVLIGHSAGAHLAARVLNQPADAHGIAARHVTGMVAISGIYEPEIVLNLSVNELAQIDLSTAERNNCLTHPPQSLPQEKASANEHSVQVAIWPGALEPDGWIEQSSLYAQTIRRAGLRVENHVVADTNHFSVLERSFEPDSAEFELICQLAGLSGMKT